MIILKYFFIILILISISCNRNPYEIEDKLYQCMVDEFEKKGVDLEVEFEIFENYLIKKQMLESKSGKSYQLLFNRMTSLDEENYIDYDRFDKLRILKPESLFSKTCLEGLDSNLIKTSKFYILSNKMSNQGVLYVDEAKAMFDSVYTVEDYGHIFNKTRMLLALLYISDIEAGIPPILNEAIPKSNYVGFSDVKIVIEDSDIIRFNDSNISFKELKIKLNIFISDYSPNYTISIYQKPTTSYGLYIKLLNLIREVIDELRNTKSMELCGVPFSENSNNNKLLEIKILIPENILEPQIKSILRYE